MNFPYFSFFWLFVKICLVFKGFKFPKEIPICVPMLKVMQLFINKRKPRPICNNHTTASAKGPQHLSNDLGTPSICITTDRDSLMQITLNRWGRSEDLLLSSPLFSQSFVNIKSSNKEDMICLCVLSVRGDLWRNFSACLRISWVYNILQPCLCVPGN